MNKNKRQINDSFFNPIYIFLLMLVYLLADVMSKNSGLVWTVLSVIGVILAIYIYVVFRRLFYWYLFSTGIFLTACAAATFFPQILPEEILLVVNGIVCVFFFIILLLFRKQFSRISRSLVSKLLPMTNNLSEMFKTLIAIISIIGASLLVYFVSLLFLPLMDALSALKITYVVLVAILIIYETIKVKVVRDKLREASWWHIINEYGKIIGSIEHSESLYGEKKYLHPLVKVMFIDNNRVYLQRMKSNCYISPGLWNSAVFGHVLVDETVEDTVSRMIKMFYGRDLNYFYLSNYFYESKLEKQYVFLFVACNVGNIVPDPLLIDQAKWWTIPQLEDNLKTGVLAEDFIREYEIVKRSGLLETRGCDCECKLKEVVYGQLEKQISLE